MSSASFPRTTRLEKISWRWFASKLYFLLPLYDVISYRIIWWCVLFLMEQIKKMIVYAVDQAVKDLKDLLKCSWLACRKLLHFAVVDDTLDFCEYKQCPDRKLWSLNVYCRIRIRIENCEVGIFIGRSEALIIECFPFWY